MNAQLGITGYNQQNNIWNNNMGTSYSSTQNNVTNIVNGGYGYGSGTSIFGGSSGVVSHVSMDSVMTAPFGAQQVSYGYGASLQPVTYAPVQQQTQQTDYTGKMMDMMMQMCMKMFEKKLDEDDDSDAEPEIIIEDTSDEEEAIQEKKDNAKTGGTIGGFLLPGIGHALGSLIGKNS